MKITQISLVSGVKPTSVSAELRVRAGHSSALCWPFQPEALTEPQGHRRRHSDPVTKSHRNQDRQNHEHSSADACLCSFPRVSKYQALPRKCRLVCAATGLGALVFGPVLKCVGSQLPNSISKGRHSSFLGPHETCILPPFGRLPGCPSPRRGWIIHSLPIFMALSSSGEFTTHIFLRKIYKNMGFP